MIGFFIALLSGAMMSVQGVFNTRVTQQSSIWCANAFVQFTAFLCCMGMWLFTERKSFSQVFLTTPKYMLLGGVIGAFITYTVIRSIDYLGPARATMFIVTTQLIISYLIEVFGLFETQKQPLSMQKLIGIGAMIAGILIFKWK